jgi:hypothetical protein
MINDVLVDLAVRGRLRSREGEGEEVDPVRPPASPSIPHADHDVRHLAVGELATPPALGAGDRRFESCQPDLAR